MRHDEKEENMIRGFAHAITVPQPPPMQGVERTVQCIGDKYRVIERERGRDANKFLRAERAMTREEVLRNFPEFENDL